MEKVMRLIGLLVIMGLGFSFGFSQVMISEVDPTTGTIELHNVGAEAVDASTMFFCNRPAYTSLSALELVSGELMIPADGFLVLKWDAIASADAELGLYSEASYNSADAIQSYIAWGSAGHGREGVAVEAGLWTAGAFLDAPTEGQTLSHVGMDDAMSDDMLAGWAATEPSLGEANGMMQ